MLVRVSDGSEFPFAGVLFWALLLDTAAQSAVKVLIVKKSSFLFFTGSKSANPFMVAA